MRNKFLLTGLILIAVTVFFAASEVVADQWVEDEVHIKQLSVYLDNNLVWYGWCNESLVCFSDQFVVPALERGSEIELRINFEAAEDMEGLRLKAWLYGYREDIEARTGLFDVWANRSYTKTLKLKLPSDLDAKESYSLHIALEAKKTLKGVSKADIDVLVQRATQRLEILSVETYGSDEKLEPGEQLFVDVVVKNRGEQEAEDVYVRASIDELGLSRTSYLGDLGYEDDEDSGRVKIVLPIPSDAEPKQYVLSVKAFNAETSSSTTILIKVFGKETKRTEGELTITVLQQELQVQPGKGVAYLLQIKNQGSTKSVTIEVEGTEGWATWQASPEQFTLSEGETQEVSIYLLVSERAVEGRHSFTVKVNYDNQSESKTLIADVQSSAGLSLERATDRATLLMIISVILAVAIIILLIVLLTRRRESYY